MNTIKIKKCDRSQSVIVTDLIIELLRDFNERSGSNFVIDRDIIQETTNKLIDREKFGCYVAFEEEKPVGLITIPHWCKRLACTIQHEASASFLYRWSAVRSLPVGVTPNS
jgi:hypothetical protein